MKKIDLIQLNTLRRHIQTVRTTCRRNYNAFVSEVGLPDKTPAYVNALYVNAQIKLLDLMQASALLESALKNCSKLYVK